MLHKLAEIESRFAGVEAELNNPATFTNPKEIQRLGKLRSDLEPIVFAIQAYKKALADVADTEELTNDPDMKEEAYAELAVLRVKITDSEKALKAMLVPRDPMDEKPVIIEIRPAAGGDEAGIFSYDLFRMYLRYCERKKWKTEVVELEETGLGGLNRVVFNVNAIGAFSHLKHESGVHRVQRVPATETQGRIHTSTATVAVLPEAEEVDVEVDPKELEISTFCSSSAGGQHMQKNETAIRIIHRPTGIVVTCQDERSQAQNKLKAMAVLRAKILQLRTDEANAERAGMRKGQIGSGDRSEKIRTYHYPESRITDHRIGLTVYNLKQVMEGDIQQILDGLAHDEQARKLAEGEAA